MTGQEKRTLRLQQRPQLGLPVLQRARDAVPNRLHKYEQSEIHAPSARETTVMLLATRPSATLHWHHDTPCDQTTCKYRLQMKRTWDWPVWPPPRTRTMTSHLPSVPVAAARGARDTMWD